jgi:hypothetical protein
MPGNKTEMSFLAPEDPLQAGLALQDIVVKV